MDDNDQMIQAELKDALRFLSDSVNLSTFESHHELFEYMIMELIMHRLTLKKRYEGKFNTK